MQETELYGKVVTFCVAIQERDWRNLQDLNL